MFGGFLTWAKTRWMRMTYPFAGFGKRTSIHHSCEIRRVVSNRMQIGDRVYIAPGTWLVVPEPAGDGPVALIIGKGCKIGRSCMISAKSSVCLEDNVMLGPSVLITDHSHNFSNVDLPIHAQGLTTGGAVCIERNCWLGHGAAVICTHGDLTIGRNSIVGANSVVTRSVPAFSVVGGNPARIIRQYDPATGEWARVSDPTSPERIRANHEENQLSQPPTNA